MILHRNVCKRALLILMNVMVPFFVLPSLPYNNDLFRIILSVILLPMLPILPILLPMLPVATYVTYVALCSKCHWTLTCGSRLRWLLNLNDLRNTVDYGGEWFVDSYSVKT